MVTSERVSAVAAAVTAVAAVTIPAILALQQQERRAENSTIAYYRTVFESREGELISRMATEGEYFYDVEFSALVKRNDELSENQKKSIGDLYGEVDDAWYEYLLTKHRKPKLHKLAIFLLETADVVYECAQFRNLFEDIGTGAEKYKWGAIKLDRDARYAQTTRGYFTVLGDFLGGFLGTRPKGPQCHQDAIIKLFGRQFSAPFWYLRRFLYCDEYIRRKFFVEKQTDASAVYRLESVAMAIEQDDLEFRYPDQTYAVMRTRSHSNAHRKDYPQSIVFAFRLEECS